MGRSNGSGWTDTTENGVSAGSACRSVPRSENGRRAEIRAHVTRHECPVTTKDRLPATGRRDRAPRRCPTPRTIGGAFRLRGLVSSLPHAEGPRSGRTLGTRSAERESLQWCSKVLGPRHKTPPNLGKNRPSGEPMRGPTQTHHHWPDLLPRLHPVCSHLATDPTLENGIARSDTSRAPRHRRDPPQPNFSNAAGTLPGQRRGWQATSPWPTAGGQCNLRAKWHHHSMPGAKIH
jgi:hypothetical protein